MKTKSQMCSHVVRDLSCSQLGVAVFKINLSYCVSLDAPVGSSVTVCLFKGLTFVMFSLFGSQVVTLSQISFP